MVEDAETQHHLPVADRLWTRCLNVEMLGLNLNAEARHHEIEAFLAASVRAGPQIRVNGQHPAGAPPLRLDGEGSVPSADIDHRPASYRHLSKDRGGFPRNFVKGLYARRDNA